jgi:ribonuclease HI
MLPEVTIYSDGAAQPNPGKGGYGSVLMFGHHRKELSQGYTISTNNRMELLGAIIALEALKKQSKVNLYTDSQYVVNGIEKGWARGWKSKGWKLSSGKPAKNSDLWDRLLNVIDQHEVKMHWVKGHAGDAENERCDQLAVDAANSNNLIDDDGYTE